MENVSVGTATFQGFLVLPNGWRVGFPIPVTATHEGLDVEATVDWNGVQPNPEGGEQPALVCTKLVLTRREGGPPVLSRAARIPVERLVKEAIRQVALPERAEVARRSRGKLKSVRPKTPTDDIIHPAYSPRRQRGRPPTYDADDLPKVAAAFRAGGIDRVRDVFPQSRTAAYELVARAKAAGHNVDRKTKKSSAKKKGGKR